MKIARRLVALVMTTLVVGAFLTIPANADTPERFAGTATARALNISLLGNNITIGSTNALGNSTPLAQANGAGVLLVPGTVSTAVASGPNVVDAPPEACLLDLPLLNLLEVALACSESRADTTGGVPNANSTAGIAALDLGALTLLQPILDQLTPLVDQTVGSVVNTLDALLGSLLTPLLGNLDLSLDSLVGDLLAGLQRATGLLSVRVGPSQSAVSTNAGAVTAQSEAQGAVIDVLPGLALSGAPLLSIVVGAAKTVSTYDRGTGTSTPSFNPAIVSVTLGLPILGEITEIPVGLGAPLTLLAGTPLESTISLGAGRTVSNPDGTVGAVADGVSLQLLKGISGGIGIELAHAESAVGGAKGAISEQTIATVLPAKELAKTGGAAPWLPLAGFGLIFVAFLTRRLVTRR
ncbi:MAG TPA: hypothetical protein VM121_10960 [Acidimicrobiales bacterium]|nr:hypothetical protein [Acidimicrobiales bacterium]